MSGPDLEITPDIKTKYIRMIDRGRLLYQKDYSVAVSINDFVVFQILISNFKNSFSEG